MGFASYPCHTFRWGIRVPGLVGAVVVDHVVHPHPFVPLGFLRVELLVCCTLPPVARVGGAVGWPRHRTPLDVKILVVGVEWGFAPIYLLQAASRRPVVRFPQSRIHSHGLEFREGNSPGFVVLVNPDRHFIHVEAVCKIQ